MVEDIREVILWVSHHIDFNSEGEVHDRIEGTSLIEVGYIDRGMFLKLISSLV